MKMMRDILLVVFGFLFSFITPALAEIANPRNWESLAPAFKLPQFWVLLALILGITSSLLIMVRDIDKKEKIQEKQEQTIYHLELEKVIRQAIRQELGKGNIDSPC